MSWYRRTELLVKEEGIQALQSAHVLVVGLGGVGAYAAESICRAGVGEMTIVDGDVVEESNRNRQLPALASNEGKEKASVMAKRFLDINPDLKLHVVNEYMIDDKIDQLLDRAQYDYVVDCIDTIAPKCYLILNSVQRNLPIVSSMGAGGRVDPSKVQVADLYKSYNCTLAKQIRKRVSKLGVKKRDVTVVFSHEDVDKSAVVVEESRNKKSTVGTFSYMPPLFGCMVASVVLRDLIRK